MDMSDICQIILQSQLLAAARLDKTQYLTTKYYCWSINVSINGQCTENRPLSQRIPPNTAQY